MFGCIGKVPVVGGGRASLESGMKAFYRIRRRGVKGNGARLDTRGRVCVVWRADVVCARIQFRVYDNMTSPGRL